MPFLPRLDISSLHAAYASGETNPVALLQSVAEVAQNASEGVWLSHVPLETVLEQARALEGKDRATLPLYGVPFAVKDNIDVMGLTTTAGCPAFAYEPTQNAEVVELLIAAGAVVIGKTNLDQFATGLNGTRSPYGVCHNAVKPDFIAGGSSSGSAVSTALGLVSFALGTDTAGSGRVPAALNNIVGLKPTRGVFSMTGVVPACRTLDTVSVFALTAGDAETVFNVAAKEDPKDGYSRPSIPNGLDFSSLPVWKLGVPDAANLQFFGDADSEKLFAQAVADAQSLGAEIIEVPFAPFLQAAKLLYEGPWVAERYRAVQSLIESNPAALLPVTREIISKGANFSAVDAFAAFEKLAVLKRQCDLVWNDVDAILTPTIPTGYTVEQLQNDPIQLNSNLGYYTNFMNLLDYSAIALPVGFRDDGLPVGVTFFAPAHQDIPLLRLGAKWQKLQNLPLGAKNCSVGDEEKSHQGWNGAISVAVCGAHLSGLPLNWQLTQRGAKLVSITKSAPKYRFYALPGGPPFRPGMIRVEEGGAPIDMEVWSVPVKNYGSFVAGIPAPLGVGTVELEDGSKVQGFICEGIAAQGAEEITAFGGWRNWMASKAK